jgi:hypothetical protein
VNRVCLRPPATPSGSSGARASARPHWFVTGNHQLDLWAEENVDRPLRTLAHVLTRTPNELLNELGGNLTRGHVDYALTGAAGDSLVAPFITGVPVAELWVAAGASSE